jgi:hypothetical protein
MPLPSNRLAKSLGGSAANRRAVGKEDLSAFRSREARTECESQEVERRYVATITAQVTAYNPSFLGVKLQPTATKALVYRRQQPSCRKPLIGSVMARA